MFVRQPTVAGSFYPVEPQELDAQISDLINQTRQIAGGSRPAYRRGRPAYRRGKPKILIAPHAGIVYSGKVAAWGFKQIENLDYSRVILLGASHQSFFNHVAIFDQGFWETPLGKVAVDEDLAKEFLDKNIISDLSPHLREHSLELELIFLQKVLKDFKILPILVSQPTDEALENLAQKISQNLTGKTLLVVSSDLSHYPSWEIANQVDQKTITAILSGKKDLFEKTIETQMRAGYPGLDTCACGREAIKITLRVAEILQMNNFKKIKYANSGDITGEKSQVVGYTAIIGYA